MAIFKTNRRTMNQLKMSLIQMHKFMGFFPHGHEFSSSSLYSPVDSRQQEEMSLLDCNFSAWHRVGINIG